MPLMISNMAAGNVSIAFGLKGKSLERGDGLCHGNELHRRGISHHPVRGCGCDGGGGTEAAVTPVGIAGFTSLTALSDSTDPARCSIPFDKDRSGFVMGEGAGVVILEELEHARKRGAHIYAEVLGYGCTSDAYHITSPRRTAAVLPEP